MPTTLIVDDDAEFLASLADLITLEGLTVHTAPSTERARAVLAANDVDLIIADLSLPDGSGIDLLRDAESLPDCDVLIVSGHATVDSAIAALRHGALDYLTKPLDLSRLRAVLTNVTRTKALRGEIGQLRRQLRKFGRFGALVGTSSAMQEMFDLVSRVAPTQAAVFISGESGTGKELVAQTVHDLSRRRASRFVAINCGAMPAALVESELFGHERGSFTGATQLRKGYFEQASGGTLFLDELAEMPIELQVKLLRVLETGKLQRLGGEQQIAVDVRIIAATNRPPLDAVREGRLREDLFYRLNVFPIALPPLRRRDDDVLLLADYFLERLNDEAGTSKVFSGTAQEELLSRSWAGNVRELKNVVERAYIMADHLIELPPSIEPTVPGAPSDAKTLSVPVDSSLALAEREHIMATLEHCGRDKRKAAAILGISLKTLYNRLNVYEAR